MTRQKPKPNYKVVYEICKAIVEASRDMDDWVELLGDRTRTQQLSVITVMLNEAVRLADLGKDLSSFSLEEGWKYMEHGGRIVAKKKDQEALIKAIEKFSTT